MSRFIDRRLNGKHKSAVNRRRFLKRYRQQIKKAVDQAIDGRSISDIGQGEKINIPDKDLSEPSFGFNQGGVQERVLPGNEEFITGDKVKRPPQGEGGGGGSQASNEGEGEDEFAFEISREEFLQFFFEDLELPDLVKKELATMEEMKSIRAGFTSSGVPTNLHVVRSLRGAMQRRIALGGKSKRRIKEAQLELEQMYKDEPNSPLIHALEDEIKQLKAKLNKIPYIDDFDLRYRNRVNVPHPSTQAVMVCLMDVSGSMTQDKKEMAKRFFMLLYLFLNRNYEKIKIVFIRHHTQAKEVDEEEFFYSRETGGTIVSSALAMAVDVIHERFSPSAWNIYVAQASDGDNWDDDNPKCSQILDEHLMPLVQYFSYIDIRSQQQGGLWRTYEAITEKHENFAMEQIENPKDIYPVFRSLFKKKIS